MCRRVMCEWQPALILALCLHIMYIRATLTPVLCIVYIVCDELLCGCARGRAEDAKRTMSFMRR